MPTRLVHLVMDAVRPARLARFWAAALGWEVAAEQDGVANVWPRGFRYPDPAALPLVIIAVPEAKAGKNRVHLDLVTESVAHQQAEVERLLGLGAVHADIGQGDVPWVVLADPEGNEFCGGVRWGGVWTGMAWRVWAGERVGPGNSVAVSRAVSLRSRRVVRTWTAAVRWTSRRSRTACTWTWRRAW